MRTPIDYWEIQVQGEHYCKLLSPYRVIEWIYIDSLYERDSRKSLEASNESPLFLQY